MVFFLERNIFPISCVVLRDTLKLRRISKRPMRSVIFFGHGNDALPEKYLVSWLVLAILLCECYVHFIRAFEYPLAWNVSSICCITSNKSFVIQIRETLWTRVLRILFFLYWMHFPNK